MHATEEEAVEETLKILDVYGRFAEEYMAMPVVKGEKTRDERFPGAVDTYSIEAMMQDHKALQAGTSHFLGQNFSKACKIKFLDQEGKEVYAWTTSWGVSTRLVGGLIMTHSDDDGLVLPPRLAPKHVVIIPIFRGDDERAEVLGYCEKLKAEIEEQTFDHAKVRVLLDSRDIRGGEKVWQHIKKGVPVRLEVGPRDIASDSVFMGRRDCSPKDKSGVSRAEFVTQVPAILEEIQKNLYDRALAFRQERTRTIDSIDEFLICLEFVNRTFEFLPANSICRMEIQSHDTSALVHFHYVDPSGALLIPVPALGITWIHNDRCTIVPAAQFTAGMDMAKRPIVVSAGDEIIDRARRVVFMSGIRPDIRMN